MQGKFSCANISSEVNKRQGVCASVRSPDLNHKGVACEPAKEYVNLSQVRHRLSYYAV